MEDELEFLYRYINPKNWGVEEFNDKEFKNAYLSARKKGLKEFIWNNKRYNTKAYDDNLFPEEYKELNEKYKKQHPEFVKFVNQRTPYNFNSLNDGERPYYVPFTKTINAANENDYIEELAHHLYNNLSKDKDTYLRTSREQRYGNPAAYDIPSLESHTHRLVAPALKILRDGNYTPEEVKQIQKKLNVKEDGIFGKETYNALVQYLQNDNYGLSDKEYGQTPDAFKKFPLDLEGDEKARLNYYNFKTKEMARPTIYKNGGMIQLEKGDDLKQYNFGGWLADNKQGVLGGLKVVGGTALLATGVGGAAGAGLIASGAGDIVGEIANDRADKLAEKDRAMPDPIGQPLINKVQMAEKGGMISRFKGFKHEQGGIPLFGVGAEVEDGETMSELQGDKIVHSDAFKITKKMQQEYGLDKSAIGKTPSRYSKYIDDMFVRDNDTYEKKDKLAMIGKLEKLSINKGQEAFMKKYGGQLTKMEGGGLISNQERVNMISSFIDMYEDRLGGKLTNKLLKSAFDNSSDVNFLNSLLQQSYLLKDIDSEVSDALRNLSLKNLNDTLPNEDEKAFKEKAVREFKENKSNLEKNLLSDGQLKKDPGITTDGTIGELNKQQVFNNELKSLSTVDNIVEDLLSKGVTEPTKEMIDKALERNGKGREKVNENIIEENRSPIHDKTKNPFGYDDVFRKEIPPSENPVNEELPKDGNVKEENELPNVTPPESPSIPEVPPVNPVPPGEIAPPENNQINPRENVNRLKYKGLPEVDTNQQLQVPKNLPEFNDFVHYDRSSTNYKKKGFAQGAGDLFLPTDLVSAGAIATDAIVGLRNNKKPLRSDYDFDRINYNPVGYERLSAQPYLNQNQSTYEGIKTQMRDSSGGSAGRYRAGLLAAGAQKGALDSQAIASIDQMNSQNQLRTDMMNAEGTFKANTYNSQMKDMNNKAYLSDRDTYYQRQADIYSNLAQNVLGMGTDYSNRWMANRISPEYGMKGDLKENEYGGFLSRYMKKYGGKIK